MLSSRGGCGFALPVAKLEPWLRLAAAGGGEASAVKKVTVCVLDEDIGRGKKRKKRKIKKNGGLWYTALLMF